MKAKTKYLTQQTWILKDARSKNSFGVWENTFSVIDTCRADNLISYTKSETYTIDEGSTKCYAVDPQLMASGIWAFQNNATQLIVDGTKIREILVLNEDSLKYTEIGPQGWGTYEAEYIYTH